ncbi:MAG TPA: DUF4234 domain-containing protein [Dehalococcoidia bacterium]|jgi:hypothetical protein|nr:DUF4234 domain-containing protein [Dehalococcoidia bacterium]HIL29917.1 DUF4234 domain-containing protein [Dehalococcoidia bacterium]
MKTDHIKKRNMIMQIFLMVITLGIYAIYWFYSTLNELHIANGNDGGALLWTILALIPLLNLFAYWHYSSEFSKFNDGKYPSIVVFVAWVLFSPLVWLLVQIDLNKAADGGSLNN